MMDKMIRHHKTIVRWGQQETPLENPSCGKNNVRYISKWPRITDHSPTLQVFPAPRPVPLVLLLSLVVLLLRQVPAGH